MVLNDHSEKKPGIISLGQRDIAHLYDIGYIYIQYRQKNIDIRVLYRL